MRIYFTGCHASGKSTLARLVSKEYNLPFLSEVARTVLAEKEISLETLRVNLDAIDNYQTEVFNRQIQEEKKYESFVSDRSFDNLAYMAQHGTQLHKLINDDSCKNYIESLRKKDVIFFLVKPSKATMKNDGVRESVNWDQMVAIDANVKFMFELFNLNYIQINAESMQERVKLVKSVLFYTKMHNI